jgi:alpha-beta hydrolase superfamily lysophospholipase
MTTRHERGAWARRVTKGPALYSYVTLPERPRAVVGLLHGYADYGERYGHVADAWAEQGIATAAIDMRGHGQAEGRRGYCDRFSQYIDDAEELVRLVEERGAGAPAVLFGHSFGGLVAASRAIARPAPWRALAVSAPYMGLALEPPPAKILAGKIASRLVPTLALPAGIRGADLTHDPLRARAYDEDPLVFKNVTARFFTESTEAQGRAIARAPALTMPLYVVIGTGDRVAKVDAARAFFDAAGSPDKTWDAREGLFHEVLNELDWRPIADRLAGWILDHAQAPRAADEELRQVAAGK